MANIRDLERLKSQIEALKTEINRSKGRRDEALRNLQEEFDVETLEEAKGLLTKIIKREKEGKATFEEALEDFNDKWAERLEA